MKNFKIIFSLFIFSFAFFALSCGDSTNTEGEPSATDNQRFTAAYVCPMHCPKSGSDTAGKCPACGMDYIALATHKADGHTHKAEPKTEQSDSHEGHDHDHNHDHDDHSGHNH